MLKHILLKIKQYYQKTKQWFATRKKLHKQRRWYIRLLHDILFIFLVFILLLFLININFLWLFGKSPRISEIRNPQQSIASEVYTSDG